MVASARAQKLLALLDVVNSASQLVLQEWEKEDNSPLSDSSENGLPSVTLYDAERTVISACGSFMELLRNPDERLISYAFGYMGSRALHVAAEHNIADHLDKVNESKGMPLSDLSELVGINPQRLSRVMRTLCSAHIFAEVRENCFANNRVSAALVKNDPLHAYITVIGGNFYTNSTKIPEYIIDNSENSSDFTPFQRAHNTPLSYWGWLDERVEPHSVVEPRTDHMLFGVGMIAAGRLGGAVCYDFPWASLGSTTIVDVGGGVGGMSIDLCKLYPRLNFVVQDLPEVIDQAPALWQRELPGAVEAGRASFMPHDFFLDNPVKGADVYLLRHIMHDWKDERCITILSGLRTAVAPHSRILIVDVVVNTTVGSPELKSAPPPLLANYSLAVTYSHLIDMNMMSLFNGVERTPAQFRALAEQAGLELVCIWGCRGTHSVVEMRLPSK